MDIPMVEQLKENGVPVWGEVELAWQTGRGKVLAITGFTPNALQQRASHCLYTIAEEQATNSASISACHAQGMLTDLLFIALIQQDLELAPERIRHSEALVKKLV